MGTAARVIHAPRPSDGLGDVLQTSNVLQISPVPQGWRFVDLPDTRAVVAELSGVNGPSIEYSPYVYHGLHGESGSGQDPRRPTSLILDQRRHS